MALIQHLIAGLVAIYNIALVSALLLLYSPLRVLVFSLLKPFNTSLAQKGIDMTVIHVEQFLMFLFGKNIILAPTSSIIEEDCLLISNHRSWADPLFLAGLLSNTHPPLRFLAKKELLWIPLFGHALRGAGTVMLERKSHKVEHQSKAESKVRTGTDFSKIEATFGNLITPATYFIFLEGSRNTPAKHDRAKSPFKHLLPPKINGFMTILKKKPHITQVFDFTLIYRDKQGQITKPHIYKFLNGTLTAEIYCTVRTLPQEIQSLLAVYKGQDTSQTATQNNNTISDETALKLRSSLKDYLNECWSEKDKLIEDCQET